MSIGFSTKGNGPTRVIVLHGWLSDSTIYDQIKPLFDETKYSLAFMDFRGYGTSKQLDGDYGIEEIAQDALSMADTLKWDSFHVLAHSMGGIVMQKMALMAPNRILSGIATTPVSAAGFDLGKEGTEFFQSSAKDDNALNEIFNTLTGKRHSSAFLSMMTASARAATLTPAYLAYLAAWTQSDFAKDVSEVSMPIRVIAGAHDLALGPEHMQQTYLRHLPNVELKVIDAAGHYPMLETPPEYFTLIEEFLDNNL